MTAFPDADAGQLWLDLPEITASHEAYGQPRACSEAQDTPVHREFAYSMKAWKYPQHVSVEKRVESIHNIAT